MRDRRITRHGRWRPACAGMLTVLALAAGPAAAREPQPFAARAGLDVARAAALSWAQDATLLYLENDEALNAQGESPRWGYLFWSPGARKSRAYTVRDGKVLAAENLDMDFDAPPVSDGWIDSGPAMAAAASVAEHTFRRQGPGQLRSMVLVRAAFDDADPDRTTWLLVYSAPGAPSLFVVVDAADGKVRRTWRG